MYIGIENVIFFFNKANNSIIAVLCLNYLLQEKGKRTKQSRRMSGRKTMWFEYISKKGEI